MKTATNVLAAAYHAAGLICFVLELARLLK
jgi:hypothetical protein